MLTSNDHALINNRVYDDLGHRWYLAQDDPVALLRAEAALRNPWIIEVLRDHVPVGEGTRSIPRVLDIGCGGGFLSNALALAGYSVDAIDLSESSLQVARAFDSSRSVRYRAADAHSPPFEDGVFDAVCAMDFLEHVDRPARVVAQAARLLRPGGLFFFHTFNRNPIAGLVVIRGVEWFVRNTPPRLHSYKLFIRPSELVRMCAVSGMETVELRGCRPVVADRAFWSMLRTGVVPEEFRFKWTRSTLISYTGYAVKETGQKYPLDRL